MKPNRIIAIVPDGEAEQVVMQALANLVFKWNAGQSPPKYSMGELPRALNIDLKTRRISNGYPVSTIEEAKAIYYHQYKADDIIIVNVI